MRLSLVLIFILTIFLTTGCTGVIDPNQVPTVIIEDTETGQRQGCERMEDIKVLRCTVIVDGKKVITEYPLKDPAPAPAPE